MPHFFFNSDIEVIEQWQDYLPTLKREMIELWVESLASEFGKIDDHSGEMTHDLSKFNSVLNTQKEVRERMHRQSERSANNQEEPSQPRRWFSLFG